MLGSRSPTGQAVPATRTLGIGNSYFVFEPAKNPINPITAEEKNVTTSPDTVVLTQKIIVKVIIRITINIPTTRLLKC